MIYEQIDEKVIDQLAPSGLRLVKIDNLLMHNSNARQTEDSKRRCQELINENKALRQEQRELWGERDQIRDEAFKNLLVEEYGVPRTHPRFDKAYGLAYDYGHSSGYSEIENYFMSLVELIKD